VGVELPTVALVDRGGAVIPHGGMPPLQDSSNKNGQRCCAFELADCSGENYILQCSTAIGVAGLLPFLGVSSLNFGPLARVAFFLGGLL
jgi:hypothetical protein